MNQAYDEQRTKILNQSGFQVLRFWNNEVLMNINGVLEGIRNTLSLALSREGTQTSTHIPGAGEGAS